MTRRWPPGLAVFRDGPPGMCDWLTCGDVRRGRLVMQRFVSTAFGHHQYEVHEQIHYYGRSFKYLTPLTPEARAVMAIARSQGTRGRR